MGQLCRSFCMRQVSPAEGQFSIEFSAFNSAGSHSPIVFPAHFAYTAKHAGSHPSSTSPNTAPPLGSIPRPRLDPGHPVFTLPRHPSPRAQARVLPPPGSTPLHGKRARDLPCPREPMETSPIRTRMEHRRSYAGRTTLRGVHQSRPGSSSRRRPSPP